MSKFDYMDLSGRTLSLFLTVYEEGSVTKAAARLDVSQSAVSHMLEKLRAITGDPLFVRSGRGIVATQRADLLAAEIRPLLASFQNLLLPPEFDPSKMDGLITIGAAALQRELLLPDLARILRREAPGVDLRVINSGVFSADLLRKNRCDLLVTPAPPEGTEFIQKKLFESRWVCFYAPSTRPPTSLDQYVARPHAKVVFSDDEKSEIDTILEGHGLSRRIALRVTSFSALPSLMRDTDLVIALPGFIAKTFMQEFSVCALPFAMPPLSFYMAWHIGKAQSPSHQWLRGRIDHVVKTLDLKSDAHAT